MAINTFHSPNWPRAGLAACVAAAAITIYMLTVPPALGMGTMDIGMSLGAIVFPNHGPGVFWIALAWHVVNGLLYVPGYVFVLAVLGIRSTAATGAVFGLFLLLAGPMTTARNIRLLIDALKASGKPKPAAMKQRAAGVAGAGQWVATVFPLSLDDKLIFAGWQCDVWIEPGKEPSQGAIYRQTGEKRGKVALVLDVDGLRTIVEDARSLGAVVASDECYGELGWGRWDRRRAASPCPASSTHG